MGDGSGDGWADWPFAHRVTATRHSPTVRLNDAAKVLAAAGHDIIALGGGEPNFDTPPWVVEAAKQAMGRGETRYTAVDGTTLLREAIAERFEIDYGIYYELPEIIVSNGAKQVIYNALAATLNPGDEVAILPPYWVSYPDIVTLLGGTPIIADAQGSLDPSVALDSLATKITSRTKWIIINSPNNPSGAVLSVDHVKQLEALLLRHPQIHLLSDDIYQHIVYNGEFTSLLHVAPSLKNRVLVVNGVSKGYAMTGWRIGYGAGPAPLISMMRKVQSQSTTSASAISQAAAVAALRGDHNFLANWLVDYRVRRDAAVGMLRQQPLLDVAAPAGAFYLFVNCARAIGKCTPTGVVINNDEAFCEFLLAEAGVAVAPGSAFGLSPYFRASFATSHDLLQAACHRIVAACDRLQ
jgi:aspartate aminotransferase